MNAPIIPGGYVLQPRKLDHSEASKLSPVTRELWSYLIRNVNYKDNAGYRRGQGFINLGNVQNELSWYVGYRKSTYSKSQLTKALRRLRELGMIATMKTSRGVIATVLNYDLYQNPRNYEGNTEGSMKAQRKIHTSLTKNKNQNKKEHKEGNTKSNDTAQDIKPSKTFSPPSVEEVIKYFISNGYTEDSAIKAFKYYEAGSWKDSKGNQVLNWKQKMRGVWFSEENQTSQAYIPQSLYNG